MPAIDLLKGFSVVIDDQVDDQDANIQGILKQINGNSIPYVSFNALPSEDNVEHFRDVSFVLLDWMLKSREIAEADIAEGATVPENLRKSNDQDNVAFIKRLISTCFCPIFIFTNESKESVIAILVEAGLYFEGRPNQIFVKSKNEVKDEDNLFAEIQKWLDENPSVYVLKEWEKEYQQSKNRLFSAFHKLSPEWPRIIWQTIGMDGGNQSLELGELILRNLQTRMMPFSFDASLLKSTETSVSREELRKVLEGERFLTELHSGAMTGDVFARDRVIADKTVRDYRLNIRAQCDLLIRPDQEDKDPTLYCIGGLERKQKDNGKFDELPFTKGGEFLEKGYEAVVPFVDGGKILVFSFREFEILKASKIVDDGFEKIGCLMPPYITKIQQRFALYFQRQGLPRIPSEAIKPPQANS